MSLLVSLFDIVSRCRKYNYISSSGEDHNDNKQRISFEWEPTLYQSGKLHRTMTIQKFLGQAPCNWQLISVPPHKKEIVRQVFKHCQRHNGPEGYQSNFFKSYHKFLQKAWSNLIIRISTKHQQQNTDQTSASKSRLNFNFKILTKPYAESLNKLQLPSLHQTFVNTFLSINISKTKQPQQVWSWHLNTQGSHQSSLLHRSELVS